MPIDAYPIPVGQIPDRVTGYSIKSNAPVQLEKFVPQGGLDFDNAYVSHFATCPNAASHSKKRIWSEK